MFLSFPLFFGKILHVLIFFLKSQQTNEIDDLIKGLRGNPGFKAYIVLNNDGVVLRWDQEGIKMPYEKAVQYSHHVLDLYDKGARQMKELFDVSSCCMIRNLCSLSCVCKSCSEQIYSFNARMMHTRLKTITLRTFVYVQKTMSSLLLRKVIISSWCYTMVKIRQRQAPKTTRSKNYKFISATTQIDVALSFTWLNNKN
jgi:hypothetical protein